MFVYKDGTKFEGKYKLDFRWGDGTLTMKDGGVLEGRWEKGILVNYFLNFFRKVRRATKTLTGKSLALSSKMERCLIRREVIYPNLLNFNLFFTDKKFLNKKN